MQNVNLGLFDQHVLLVTPCGGYWVVNTTVPFGGSPVWATETP